MHTGSHFQDSVESSSCGMDCFLNVYAWASKFPMFSSWFYHFICFKHFSSFFLPDFGELSKKLAEVWKQLPEKDKLVSVCEVFL